MSEPSDEWRQFFGSAVFGLLAVIVLAGSFAVSMLVGSIYNAVVGPP